MKLGQRAARRVRPGVRAGLLRAGHERLIARAHDPHDRHREAREALRGHGELADAHEPRGRRAVGARAGVREGIGRDAVPGCEHELVARRELGLSHARRVEVRDHRRHERRRRRCDQRDQRAVRDPVDRAGVGARERDPTALAELRHREDGSRLQQVAVPRARQALDRFVRALEGVLDRATRCELRSHRPTSQNEYRPRPRLTAHRADPVRHRHAIALDREIVIGEARLDVLLFIPGRRERAARERDRRGGRGNVDDRDRHR